MRSERARRLGLGAWGLLACTPPAGDGDGTGDTTVVVASFGEDGPTGGSTTSTTTSTSTSTSASTSTSTSTSTSATESDTETTVSDASTSGEPGEDSSSGEPPPPPPPTCATIEATIRDFTVDHVDMAMPGGGAILPGLVLGQLGGDGAPVYDTAYAGPVSISSADSFAQWYSDVPEVNLSFVVQLELYEESPGRTVFDSAAFYPIDGVGFGNEGESNNYYFTTAVHTSLTYQGGEVMSFGGDDDVWVFLDGRLVADVGGQHAALYVDVVLDDLLLEPGQSYALDVFHAERGVGGSQLRFELGDLCD